MDREIKFKIKITSPDFDSGVPFLISDPVNAVDLMDRNLDLTFPSGETMAASDIDWMKDDVELIQFTGLTDKNDKEIYEGDVVNDAVGRTWIVEYSEERASFEFSWNKNRLGKQVFSRFNKYQKPLEVLGNVHENPELLEVKS